MRLYGTIPLVREQLAAKLRPDGFSAMSGRMAAIVGYILDERFSEPANLGAGGHFGRLRPGPARG